LESVDNQFNSLNGLSSDKPEDHHNQCKDQQYMSRMASAVNKEFYTLSDQQNAGNDIELVAHTVRLLGC